MTHIAATAAIIWPFSGLQGKRDMALLENEGLRRWAQLGSHVTRGVDGTVCRFSFLLGSSAKVARYIYWPDCAITQNAEVIVPVVVIHTHICAYTRA